MGCATDDDDSGAFANEAMAVELNWLTDVDLDLSVDVPPGLTQATDFNGSEDVLTGPGYEYFVSNRDRSESDYDGQYIITVTLTTDGAKPPVQPIPFDVTISALGWREKITGSVRSVENELTHQVTVTKTGNRILIDN